MGFDDSRVIPLIQADLFGGNYEAVDGKHFKAPEIDLNSYDHIIVAMSGGKDSWACVLDLLERGVDKSKMELWHHAIDGMSDQFMDWAFMESYCEKLAEELDIPMYFSWLEDGFRGELLKENSFSKSHWMQTPEGTVEMPRDHKRSKPATRLRFPQLSPDLRVRWCSSSLKIDLGRRCLSNQDRFHGKKVLFVTGERRQESANRARYFGFEPHITDARSGRLKRTVDAYRPVLEWTEEQVWEIFERNRIEPPVPYKAGWSRSSCMTCIYSSDTLWATMKEYFPDRVKMISDYEEQFQTTISREKVTVWERASRAKPIVINDPELILQITSKEYFMPVKTPEGKNWELPIGAFGKESAGAD